MTQILILNLITFTISKTISIMQIICTLRERAQKANKNMMKKWMNKIKSSIVPNKIKNIIAGKNLQMTQVLSTIDNKEPSLQLKRLISQEVELSKRTL